MLCSLWGLAYDFRRPWSSSSPAKESAPPRTVSERAVGEMFRDALKGGGEGPEMAVLPTGNFRIGSPSGEAGRYRNEGPVRTVTIGRRIAMGRYEVTFEDYDRFTEGWGFPKALFGKKPADNEGWGRGSRLAWRAITRP